MSGIQSSSSSCSRNEKPVSSAEEFIHDLYSSLSSNAEVFPTREHLNGVFNRAVAFLGNQGARTVWSAEHSTSVFENKNAMMNVIPLYNPEMAFFENELIESTSGIAAPYCVAIEKMANVWIKTPFAEKISTYCGNEKAKPTLTLFRMKIETFSGTIGAAVPTLEPNSNSLEVLWIKGVRLKNKPSFMKNRVSFVLFDMRGNPVEPTDGLCSKLASLVYKGWRILCDQPVMEGIKAARKKYTHFS